MIEPDHLHLHAIHQHVLVYRIRLAEELLRELLVHDHHSSRGGILGIGEAAPGIDVAAINGGPVWRVRFDAGVERAIAIPK